MMDIFINRMYYALKKVNNQSPFIGSIVILSLLISCNVLNILLVLQSNRESHIIIGKISSIFFIIVLYFIIYGTKIKSKAKIINMKFKDVKKINFFVFLSILITLIMFIKLSNVNRQKIFKGLNQENNTNPKSESLEGTERKWFD